MKYVKGVDLVFENIKHTDDNNNEFWYARELMIALEYNKWDKFLNVIEKASYSCVNSGFNVLDHFPQVGKMVKIGSESTRLIKDYKLSRYACYLIAQNSDSRKKVVSFAQSYFAIQTRKQEIYNNLTKEDKERLFQREIIKKENKKLVNTAKESGVRNFDKFHNFGYKGLYNGENADDISKRKCLRYREEILDNMGTEELAANLFRISLTEQKLRNENIKGEGSSNKAHYQIGKNIRNVIKKSGGTMPEDLPTPKKSIKEINNNRH